MKIKIVFIILFALVFVFACTSTEVMEDEAMMDDGDGDAMDDGEAMAEDEFDDGLDDALADLDALE